MSGDIIPLQPPWPATLPHALRDARSRHDGRDFLIAPDRRWSYREVDDASAQLALGLLAMGVGKGTRVALLAPNGPEWVVWWFAAARIGALTLPVSTFFSQEELAWHLREADVHTLITCARYLQHDYLDRLVRALPELQGHDNPHLQLRSHPFLRQVLVDDPDSVPPWAHSIDTVLGDVAGRNGPDRALLHRAEDAVVPADLLIGICTSGTTDRPKIVVHTHASAIRNTWCYRPYVGIAPNERSYTGSAFFWVAGLNGNLLPTIYEGAALVFAASPAPADVLDAVSRHRVTRLNMWKPQLAQLQARAVERGMDLSDLKGIAAPRDCAGTQIPADRRIVSMMGMSETFGPHSMEAYDTVLPLSQAGSWGRGLRGVERRIVDADNRQPVPAGQVGELMVRGFSLMQGYYKRERADVFTPDGWFATGDRARIDEGGHIYFAGRSGEMIKTSGANVAPREVEAALEGAPGVNEAIVLGLPDDERGEIVAAVIVRTTATATDETSLRTWLRPRLSAYKIPRRFEFVSDQDVPRTASRKPRKAALRERLLGQRGDTEMP